LQIKRNATETKRSKLLFRDSTFGGVQVDDPALQPDRDRMRPVVRPEFRMDFRDVAFHRLLGYRQPGGDFVIANRPMPEQS
jgi:hypothetical protein